jgi:hypothetical protein
MGAHDIIILCMYGTGVTVRFQDNLLNLVPFFEEPSTHPSCTINTSVLCSTVANN